MGEVFKPFGKGADRRCRFEWVGGPGSAIRLVAKHRDCPFHAGVVGIPVLPIEDRGGIDETPTPD